MCETLGMVWSMLIVVFILESSVVKIQADFSHTDDCHINTEFVTGYCPSTCEVEAEMQRFSRETEDYLTQHDVFLQEIKQSVQHLSTTYDTFEDMVLEEQQTTLRRNVDKLYADAYAQKEFAAVLLRNITQLRVEMEEVLQELEIAQQECKEFCNGSEHISPLENKNLVPCGDDDTLCFKAAHDVSATMIQETQNSVLCPRFETAPAKSCAELYIRGHRDNGVYRITPKKPVNSFYVYCDMQDAGGGWTVIQRRQDGSLEFNRTWQEYAAGFGRSSCSMEFWLGNENLATIGKTGFQTARFVMTDWENVTRVAQYSYFKVNSADHLYTLQLSYYQSSESNCSDSMTMPDEQNNAKFSTWDKKLPSLSMSCRATRNGWWMNSCQQANLNGFYHGGAYDPGTQPTGIVWPSWRGLNYSLRKTEIKLRPYDFFTGGS